MNKYEMINISLAAILILCSVCAAAVLSWMPESRDAARFIKKMAYISYIIMALIGLIVLIITLTNT